MDPIELTIYLIAIRLFVYAYQSYTALLDEYLQSLEVINASISKGLEDFDGNK